MKRVVFFVIIPLLLLTFAAPVYADCTLGGSSPNYTVSASCSFAGTVNGVDAGTGTNNTANLTLQGTGQEPENTTTLTVGNAQTLAMGSLTVGQYAQVILPEGAVIVLKQPIWVSDVIDADGDGFWGMAGGGNMEISTTQPSGKVRKNAYSAPGSQDCNDTGVNSVNVATSATCYVDTDNDSYGSTTQKTCISPGATCATATWASGVNGTVAAAGNFADNDTDCNDTANGTNVHVLVTTYTDNDKDTYTTGVSTYNCLDTAIVAAAEWASVGTAAQVDIQAGSLRAAANGSDCNDNQPTLALSATCYLDADNDDRGANNSAVYNCIQPSTTCATTTQASTGGNLANGNFWSTNTDCNDTGSNSQNVSTSATCYVDTDNDSYGSTTLKTCITKDATCASATWASGTHGTAAAAGNFAANNTDCNDTANGNNVHVSVTTYDDQDGDTYTTGVSPYNCLNTATVASATWGSIGTTPQNNFPAGSLRGAANGNDCNQSGTNAAYVQLAASCYQDLDDDGYGAGSVVSCIPADTTCANAYWGSGGNGTTAYNVNHSAVNTDCCDNNATASPAQTGWFSTAIPAGCAASNTFNWNCSSGGTIEKLYAENGTCYYSGGCQSVLNVCVGASTCGQNCTRFTGCSRSPYGAYCVSTTGTLQQQCH